MTKRELLQTAVPSRVAGNAALELGRRPDRASDPRLERTGDVR